MVEERIEFVCSICGRVWFSKKSLDNHEKWHNKKYKENISKKLKMKWRDPNSKYNSPEYRVKLRDKNIDSPSSNNPKEVIVLNNHHLEFFEKYLITHNYFDQKSIVNDYIRSKFSNGQIQSNIQVNIEKSFDILIKNNLEIGKIEYYTPPIYRSKKG